MVDQTEIDRVLECVLTGALAESSEEARAVFAASPEAKQRLKRLRALQTRLDAQGGVERAELAAVLSESGDRESGDGETSSLERLVESTVQRALTPRRPRIRGWSLAAAAVLLGVVAIWALRRPGAAPSAPADIVLGTSSDDGALRQLGSGVSFRGLEWDAMEGADRYEIVVYDSDAAEDSAVLRHDADDNTAWHPRPGELTRIRGIPRLRCELRVFDVLGKQIGERTVDLHLREGSAQK